MMKFLLGIPLGIYKYIIIGFTLLGTFLSFRQRYINQGKQEIRDKINTATRKKEDELKEIDSRPLPIDDVFDSLQRRADKSNGAKPPR
jgi:hypothetical protein